MIAPGAYLRLRREAAGLTLEEVSLVTETVPSVCARVRTEWIAAIEQGIAPVSIDVALALQIAFPFDFDVLVKLCAFQARLIDRAPRVCEVCGCSEQDACVEQHGGPCGWAEPARCSACVGKPLPFMAPPPAAIEERTS